MTDPEWAERVGRLEIQLVSAFEEIQALSESLLKLTRDVGVLATEVKRHKGRIARLQDDIP